MRQKTRVPYDKQPQILETVSQCALTWGEIQINDKLYFNTGGMASYGFPPYTRIPCRVLAKNPERIKVEFQIGSGSTVQRWLSSNKFFRLPQEAK